MAESNFYLRQLVGIAQTGVATTVAPAADNNFLLRQLVGLYQTSSGGGGGSYTLPPATASTLGGIKVGSGLSITGDGTLSSSGGGGTITLTGDTTGSGTSTIATTTKGINGVLFSGLATGLLQNTTTTGLPSVLGNGTTNQLLNITSGAPAWGFGEFGEQIITQTSGSVVLTTASPSTNFVSSALSGTLTLTLPQASTCPGKVFSIIRNSSTGGSFGIVTAVFSGDTISQNSGTVTSILMQSSGGSGQQKLKIQSMGGTTWIILQDATLGLGQGGTGASLGSIAPGGSVYAASTVAFASTAAGLLGQILNSNAASPPTWVSFTGSQNSQYFGDGSDGNVTLSSGTSNLTRDMFYNNLTISGTGKIGTFGFKIYVSGILDITAAGFGAIQFVGNQGGNASGSTAGTAATASTAGSLAGNASGVAGVNGVVGAGANGTAGTLVAIGAGGSAGAGGAGGTSGTGGTRGNITAQYLLKGFQNQIVRGVTLVAAGAGGGSGASGAGDGSNTGGGGGGAGASGGVIWISAATVNRGASTTAGSINVIGGNGGGGGNAGAGNANGGGGGGGGGGGVIYFYYGILTGSTATNVLTVDGGSGGAGGNALGTGIGGTGGNGAGFGSIYILNLLTNSGTFLAPSSSQGNAGGAPSGTTGGTAGTPTTQSASI